jgi:hypothetical protein
MNDSDTQKTSSVVSSDVSKSDAARDESPRPTLQQRIDCLDKIELRCLNDPDIDSGCRESTVTGLMKIIAYYEHVLLKACQNPATALKIRADLQTYVALLRTLEKFEIVDLRRAELNNAQKSRSLSGRKSNPAQYFP